MNRMSAPAPATHASACLQGRRKAAAPSKRGKQADTEDDESLKGAFFWLIARCAELLCMHVS